jgi:hypothetical protein
MHQQLYECDQQLQLFGKQKLDYMHHLFDAKAKKIYREKIFISCTTFAKATSMMQEVLTA